jgi:hypothetical protein
MCPIRYLHKILDCEVEVEAEVVMLVHVENLVEHVRIAVTDLEKDCLVGIVELEVVVPESRKMRRNLECCFC